MNNELPNGWIFIPYTGLTNLKIKSFDYRYVNEKFGITIIETQSNHRNNIDSIIRRMICFNIIGVDTSESFEFEIPKNISIKILLENYNNLFMKLYYLGFTDKLLNKI